MRQHIVNFLKEKNNTCFPELESSEWINDLAFTVDLLKHWKILNLKLQGKNLLVHDMYENITVFMDQLQLWQHSIQCADLKDFPTLNSRKIFVSSQQYDNYTQTIHELHLDFSERFHDFDRIKVFLEILSSLFTFEIRNAPTMFQLELIELQSNERLKYDFENKTIIEFFHSLDARRFKNLRNFAMKCFSMFGSTYVCESAFSIMNLNKSKLRSQLTDAHLLNNIRIATSNIEPNFDDFVREYDTR